MTLILSGTDGLSDIDGSVSTPAIRGTDANTGVYFPGADRLGFSTGGVQRGEFDASGNFLMNSGYGSVATAYGCRAWVNFNGTGTVAIRASGNVTSITDNGTGDYTVNFTTAMPDVNYSPTIGYAPALNGSGQAARVVYSFSNATGSYRVTSKDNGGSAQDFELISVAIFR
jgi:hypothetical protein